VIALQLQEAKEFKLVAIATGTVGSEQIAIHIQTGNNCNNITI